MVELIYKQAHYNEGVNIMIVRTAMIVEKFQHDFQVAVTKKINEFQERSLEVEIKYALTDKNYTALILGKKKDEIMG